MLKALVTKLEKKKAQLHKLRTHTHEDLENLEIIARLCEVVSAIKKVMDSSQVKKFCSSELLIGIVCCSTAHDVVFSGALCKTWFELLVGSFSDMLFNGDVEQVDWKMWHGMLSLKVAGNAAQHPVSLAAISSLCSLTDSETATLQGNALDKLAMNLLSALRRDDQPIVSTR